MLVYQSVSLRVKWPILPTRAVIIHNQAMGTMNHWDLLQAFDDTITLCENYYLVKPQFAVEYIYTHHLVWWFYRLERWWFSTTIGLCTGGYCTEYDLIWSRKGIFPYLKYIYIYIYIESIDPIVCSLLYNIFSGGWYPSLFKKCWGDHWGSSHFQNVESHGLVGNIGDWSNK